MNIALKKIDATAKPENNARNTFQNGATNSALNRFAPAMRTFASPADEQAMTTRITRRTAIRRLAGTLPAFAVARAVAAHTGSPGDFPGMFSGARDSFGAYRIPRWFRDAKFGIWAHWGPQSAPEYGDWYARNIYIQNSRQNRFHIEHYGHPSRFGYKDIIQTWRGDLFDADNLVSLYQKAGAKYFVSLANHHDNFDNFKSRFHDWNSTRIGRPSCTGTMLP